MLLDASLLIEKNYKKNRTRIRKVSSNGEYFIDCQSQEQTSLELLQILSEIKAVIKAYGGSCRKIILLFRIFNPRDKLVYILLECILYTIMNAYHKQVDMRVGGLDLNINTEGWRYTPSCAIAQFGYNNEFNLYFQNDFAKNHYRKVLTDPTDVEAPARLVTDIKTFLDRFHMRDEFDGKLAYTIGELADNALCHAHTPCLIDIDITEKDYQATDSEDVYYAVNVVVLNFGEKCLYNDIIEKIEHKYYKTDSRYIYVEEAYKKQSMHFDKKYGKEEFYLVSTFQDEISGRPNESYSGGTGLPELIRTLEEYADEDFCYVLSGHSSLLFKKEMLNFDEDGWIGFNSFGNFLEEIPDTTCIDSSYTFLPGTGYNFMLIFKGDQQDGE